MIPVFYRPEMVARAASFSRSPEKPALVVQDWLESGLPIDICSFEPVSRTTLSAAHEKAYVEGVLDGRLRNGFGNTLREVATSLPYTSGSLVAAVTRALKTGIACSPSSGFHHAGWSHGGGFCTFNGLVVASLQALSQLPDTADILILDCDMHYGDGTENCLEQLAPHVRRRIVHETFGANYRHPSQASQFFDSLPALLETNRAKTGLILYQAGADVHVDDPLGGWLTTEQMRRRDDLVFRFAAEHKIPLAWNLAGGYQTPLAKVVHLHRQTMIACVEAYMGSSESAKPSP